jgi:hypothetical protein
MSRKPDTQIRMPDTTLVSELTKNALELLEQRFKILSAPAWTTDISDWDRISPNIGSVIPAWYKHIVSTYRVMGGVLEYRGGGADPVRVLSLFGPEDFAIVLAEDSLMRPLLDHGYFPFANESDGNAWLCTGERGPEGDVYLLELSSWDRGEPTPGNGLIFAASRLSYLLTSMGVSEASYYGQAEGPARVIWYRDK